MDMQSQIQPPVAKGLLGIVTPEDTQRMRDAKIAAMDGSADEQRRMINLASYIEHCWQAAQDAKVQVEQRIIDCRQMVKRIYSPTVLAKIREYGGSETYIGTVAVKCMAAESWLSDIMLPPDDKPWELLATPIPSLPDDAVAMIVDLVTQKTAEMQALGQVVTPDVAFRMADEMRERQLKLLKEEAEARAKRMENVIEDQLVDGKFQSAMRDFIQNFVQTPAGIIKAPVVRKRKMMEWGQNHEPIINDAYVYECESVDPLDFYPSPRMKPDGLNDGYIIERMMLTRKELVAFKDVPGVSNEAIDRVLDESGRNGIRNYLSVDSSRDNLSGRTSQQQTTHSDAEFEVLEFWGSVSGDMLIEWGMEDGVEPTAEYEVVARKCGNHVIHAMVNPDPLGRRPYHVASFKRDASSVWGESLPEILTDIQEINNSIIRHFQNNQAFAAGAQVAVDASKLAAGMDFKKAWPGKVWAFEKLNDGTVPIQFFQARSNIEATIRSYTFFDTIADDISGIPKYTYGNGDGEKGGAGSTASGLSMLMGNANKRIRDVVTTADIRIIKEVIEAFFVLNMLNHPDANIKGDVQIQARGALSLMVKEQVQQRRGQFLASTANPIDMQIMGVEGRARLLREVAKTLNLPDGAVVPDELELQRRLAEQQQAAAAQQQAAMQPGGTPPQNGNVPQQPPGAPQ
jgi:hypothetical protein